MIINNPEALKNWLVIILEPLCDADSSALARYVLALLKKDKPFKELKKIMIEQLDVFLAEETKPFVERLFSAIGSEEYLAPILSTVSIQNAMKSGPAAVLVCADRELTPPLDDTKTKDLYNKIEESGNNLKDVTKSTTESNPTVLLSQSSSIPPPPPTGEVRCASPFKATSDKENQPRESRRCRTSLKSRSRSRSRSNDRSSRRSRSRDRRQNEREKNTRMFRNKSPPVHNERKDRRGADRRRGSHANDERSPRMGFVGNTRTKSHSASRSRSPSLEMRKLSPSERASNRSPFYENENSKRQRCRDFDEKGYCVRGETCPWDHGINPVVFEGINNSALISMSLREYNPDAPDLWSRGSSSAVTPSVGNITNGGNVSASGNSLCSGPRGNFPHKGGNGALPGAYPHAVAGANFRSNAPIFPFPTLNTAATPLQRELIPVPVMDSSGMGGDISAVQSKRRFELEDSVAIAEGPAKRKLPLSSRLGPRIINIQNNCSLELRKIPRGMNTIAHLNNHFAKFGKIVNIQISYEGDPEAAIVTFSTHAEANVAYRSTEAVLNNRFIKVFWHSQDISVSGNPQMTSILKDDSISVPGNGSGRKSSQYHLSNVPAVPTPTADAAKIPVPTSNSPATLTPTTSQMLLPPTVVATPHVPPPSLRVKNNTQRITAVTTAIIRKKQEDQAKAVVQLANGLRKRKQELLQGYMKQMKSAVEIVERCEPQDPQRVLTVETIKTLQEKIDKLRKEIATEQEQMAAQIQNQQPSNKKTKEQQKKELLDIELELFAQQQEGNDTTAIQKRLENLQRSLGIGFSTKNHFSTSGTRIKHTRGTLPAVGSTSVDRRPKSIVVTGFASEDCDMLLAHFRNYGEVIKNDVEKSIPQIIVTYATRLYAEQAVLRGKIFKEKRLQIAWAPTVQNGPSQVPQKSISECSSKVKFIEKENNGNSDIDTTDILPELRLEDEEEDDESEDRSWRR